jgi:transposase InsO family protein
VKAYIDRCRDAYGVEPICKVLQIAPSCHRRHAARLRNPALRSRRAQRDDALIPDIKRVWQANWHVYGADKVWKQMNREGIRVARCTVERLMKHQGLQGVRRGKVVRTTTSDTSAPRPLDRVQRVFKAERPNQLWVSDFTYVSTWLGWLYVAFVIDVFARRIVGWRVSSTMRTDFVLDALEQALYDRQPASSDALVHHSDRGSLRLKLRQTTGGNLPARPLWRSQLKPTGLLESRGGSVRMAVLLLSVCLGAPISASSSGPKNV